MSILKKSMILLLAVATITSCSVVNKVKNDGINLFTIQQDREFGAQVAAEIDGNRAEYPLLDSVRNKEVYAYVYKVRNNILNSGKVQHKDDFQWRVRIINNDSILNAFCTPGGYIYIYTGILKFMESEDQFAGVLGHEIAHADLRHSTRQMTKLYGVDALLNIVAGKYEMIKQMTESIVSLKFSRDHETEADQRSVEYLCPTPYNAAGGAGFFQKMENLSKGGKQFEFLSTHPNPANRIEHFQAAKTDLGCLGTQTYKNEYQAMLKKIDTNQGPIIIAPPIIRK
ncbi:MAG: M48 family metallopeptidase [Crocinitomicaceae bacterium]|nr:M48 family metallopeptidase [Crocinitomicaceae bacterium]